MFKSLNPAAFAGALSTLALLSIPASAGTGTMYIGETFITAGSYCPAGTTEANGAQMSVNEYPALFSVLGITYGGNASQYFNLPDLRGRVPVHSGTGPGLSPYDMGDITGAEIAVMYPPQMPPHRHSMNASSVPPNDKTPEGNALSSADAPPKKASTNQTLDGGEMYLATVGHTGSPTRIPFSITQPTLPLLYCVVIDGPYPPRS